MSLFDDFTGYCRDFFKYNENSSYQIFENDDFLLYLRNEIKFLSSDDLLSQPDFSKNLKQAVKNYFDELDFRFAKRQRKKDYEDKKITMLKGDVSSLNRLQDFFSRGGVWMRGGDECDEISREISNLINRVTAHIEYIEQHRYKPPLLSDINKKFDNALGELLQGKTDLSITDLAKDITALRQILRKIFDDKPLNFFTPKN